MIGPVLALAVRVPKLWPLQPPSVDGPPRSFLHGEGETLLQTLVDVIHERRVRFELA